MLSRAVGLAAQIAIQPRYIDKPLGGVPFPLDSVWYMEHEQHYSFSIHYGRELEVFEARHGFVPLSGEMVTSRVRRRYRLAKGGHPCLVLVHYSRGQSISVPPPLQAQPVRQYPLRPHNEQAVFVLGEREGQRVPPPGPVGANPGQVNASRPARVLDQRQPPQPPQRLDEEDSADELEHISTRTLVLTRYRRNHELMNEVFTHAAFAPAKAPALYSIFEKAELETRVEELTKEIEELRAKSVARRATRDREESADMSIMDEAGAVTIPSVIVV
ncbi:hypothetical protein BJV78DRAFT_1282810 [Lactifluus subvellereus]|nr:hypothetical protein BJV78DRAFT_1282810 [Lactifluus subvellereus]